MSHVILHEKIIRKKIIYKDKQLNTPLCLLNSFMSCRRKTKTSSTQFILFIEAISLRIYKKERLTTTFIIGHNKTPTQIIQVKFELVPTICNLLNLIF